MSAPLVARAFVYTAVAAAMMGVAHRGPARLPVASIDGPAAAHAALPPLVAHAG